MPNDGFPSRYIRRIRGTTAVVLSDLLPGQGVGMAVDDSGALKHYSDVDGATIISVDATHAQTIAGAKTFTGATALTGGLTINAGTGAATVTPVGVLTVSTAIVTSAATAKTTNISYSLPANTLSADGKGIRITTWGTCAGNGNNKTVTVDVGAGAAIAATTGAVANNAGHFRLVVEVIRTGAAALACSSLAVSNATAKVTTVTDTSDTTAAILIAITSTNGTASDDTIHKGYLIEALG